MSFPSKQNDCFKEKPMVELKSPYLTIIGIYHLKLKPISIKIILLGGTLIPSLMFKLLLPREKHIWPSLRSLSHCYP